MSMPVMGDATPVVKKAVEDAERVCPTDSHRYGYMISVAQGLEIELAAASAPTRRKQNMSYDHRCYDLAEVYMSDQGLASREEQLRLTRLLAQHIQDEIDEWLEHEVTTISHAAGERSEEKT